MSRSAKAQADIKVPLPAARAHYMSTKTPRLNIAVVAFWYALTITTGIVSPEILAALMKTAPRGPGLLVSSAGLLLTVEMIANGVVGLSARLFERFSSRSLVIAGFAANLFANVVTAAVTGLGPLMAMRIAAGAGLGLVVIAASRFIAAAEDPDRLSSLLMVVSTILNGVVLIAFGNSSPSAAAVFGTFAALAGLGLLTTLLPAGPYAHATTVKTAGSAGATAASALLPMLLLIAATGLLNTADAGLYTLTSVVAAHVGVGEDMLGYILTGAMVAGIAGAVGAGWLHSPASRTLGLIGSILLKACVAFALVRMTGVIGFGAMATLYSVTYFFALPLLLGASAHLDRGGRLASQVSGAVQIGGALGPAWAGVLDEVSGTRAVAAVCTAALVGTALLCWVPLRAVRRPFMARES